ncbi:MAG TPA: CBS domain-containing protein [Thermoplasmata archaeon]|nr:CBS domain-containing protein [Thermoplasmata archaeon]
MPAAWPTAADLMTSRPVTLPHDAPISRALGLMRDRGFHEIPVLRNSRLAGMITFESIARRVSRALSTKVEHLLILPPLIVPSASMPEVAEQLLATGLRGAPVVGRRGELLGIVSRSDLIRAIPGLPQLSTLRIPLVEEVASPATHVIREDELCRHLVAQIRLLEEHPLPVVDRKGRLVGAVGVKDLGKVLWRPIRAGKRDPGTARSALEVEVGSIMHSPPVTVEAGSDIVEAARRMVREDVSSLFVIEDHRPTRVLGQADLLGLVIGRSRPAGQPTRVEDVYVEISGLRGSGDPALFAEIDHLVARGLRRVARHVRPTLLSLHFAPHATHRTNELTVEARLHTDDGIYYASHTGWNLLAGISGLMEELAAQARRTREENRRRGRPARRTATADSEETGDAELEEKIRTAAGDDE